MNSDERQLIAGLFERLQAARSTPKDQEADLFIRDLLERFPDAPYFLVQSVLVQEQALQRADVRIRELEDSARRGYVAPRGDSSFLGGARAPDRVTSGSQARFEPPNDGPWSRSAAAPQADNRTGGFLSSALSTATGVAGGMFLADSIRSLFGGSGGRTGDTVSASDQAKLDRAQDNQQDAEDDAQKARSDLAEDDAALDDMQDADYDDGDWSDDSIDV